MIFVQLDFVGLKEKQMKSTHNGVSLNGRQPLGGTAIYIYQPVANVEAYLASNLRVSFLALKSHNYRKSVSLDHPVLAVAAFINKAGSYISQVLFVWSFTELYSYCCTMITFVCEKDIKLACVTGFTKFEIT